MFLGVSKGIDGRKAGRRRHYLQVLIQSPLPSVQKVSSGSSIGIMSEEDAEHMSKAGLSARPLDPVSCHLTAHMPCSRRDVSARGLYYALYSQTQVVSTAAGVLVLAAAAVAVASLPSSSLDATTLPTLMRQRVGEFLVAPPSLQT
jgi:hypothetical protein